MQVDCTEQIVGGLGILLERLLTYRKEYEKRRSDFLAQAGRMATQLEKLDTEISCVSLLVEAWRDRDKQAAFVAAVEAPAEAPTAPAEAPAIESAAPKTKSKGKGK